MSAMERAGEQTQPSPHPYPQGYQHNSHHHQYHDDDHRQGPQNKQQQQQQHSSPSSAATPMWGPVPSYSTWLSGVERDSPFSLANVPLGIISTTVDRTPRVATALGIWVLDLRELARQADLGQFLPELDDGRAKGCGGSGGRCRSRGSGGDGGGGSAAVAHGAIAGANAAAGAGAAGTDTGAGSGAASANANTDTPDAGGGCGRSSTAATQLVPPPPGGRTQQPAVPARRHVFDEPTLNAIASLGRNFHRRLRHFIQNVFSDATPVPWLLRDNEALKERVLLPRELVRMHLPMRIGDYTDFYAGYHHAYAVGVLFRGPHDALQPNYTHMPIGYHGRASSVVVSETPIRRPTGQVLLDSAAAEKQQQQQPQPKRPATMPSQKLDFELEIGCFVCGDTELGESIPVDRAEDHIFGYVLLNDWSARDIQAWEYVPLGPFNGKNFATTISPWVVLADALEPFRTEALANDTEPQPYLAESREKNVFDLRLEVDLTTPDGYTAPLTRVSSRHLLWSFPQMIAHHTLGGCPLRTGDIIGTGTISGLDREESGSLLEMSDGGKTTIRITELEGRTFLQDGDTVTLRGWAEEENGFCVGFGECVGRIEGP